MGQAYPRVRAAACGPPPSPHSPSLSPPAAPPSSPRSEPRFLFPSSPPHSDDIRVALVPITTIADLKEVVGRRFPEEIKYQQFSVSVPDAAAEGGFKEAATDEEVAACLTAAADAVRGRGAGEL